MPTIADLTNASGFGLFAFLALTIGVGVVRGWLVPGWIYHQEREQRIKAETQADRNTESLALLARFADARRPLSDPDEK